MSALTQRVVHVVPRVQSRGGIETLLAYHREMPGPQVFVSLFDRQPQVRPDYVNLGVTWRTPLWLMRERFRRALAPYPGSLLVYHNAWGLPLFHDLDGASRRVIFLHADPAYHQPDLPGCAGLIDGALGCCPEFAAAWPEILRELPPARTAIYRMPLGPAALAEPERTAGGPIVLGYAGRIERAQKCLHLLPEFVRILEARGVDFRFEVVGDGSLKPWLEKRAGDRVHFHGWVPSDADYQRVIAAWDATVFFSDHEGGPIALMEAMRTGAVPFYPTRAGGWGEYFAPQVDPRCRYPAADLTALAAAIEGIFHRPAEDIAALRAKARQLVAGHDPEGYQACCRELLDRIAGLPRISVPRARRRRLTDSLPLGLVTRAVPAALRGS